MTSRGCPAVDREPPGFVERPTSPGPVVAAPVATISRDGGFERPLDARGVSPTLEPPGAP